MLYEITKFFYLWFCLKMIGVKRYIGRLVGVDDSTTDLSAHNSHFGALSRPIDQIVRETFANEFFNVGLMDLAKMCDLEASQIRVLTLNLNEHQTTSLYRLKKTWILQFRIGPTLFGRKIDLFCNYPKTNVDFKRNVYCKVEWMKDVQGGCSDDTSLYAIIKLNVAGSFHYYFNCNGEEQCGSGYFLVDPILHYGEDEALPLDCIQCQTVLAKSLGKFDTWEGKLRVAKESGYNMIHFTPIQELGGSNSSYSLSNQLKLNPLFDAQKIDVEAFLSKMRKEWKMTSICDIVLNHTANESPWLVEHPEATYNCMNCTYMRPAYLLDAALYQFSLDIKAGLYENKGIPPVITTEEHLQAIRYALHNDVLKALKLHELYTCDTITIVTKFAELLRHRVPRTNSDQVQLELIQDPLYRRLHSNVDMEKALQIYNTYRNDCFDEEARIKKCTALLKAALDELNDVIIRKLNDDLNAAVENCIGSVRYFRVDANGPKFTEISTKQHLFYRYFTDYNRPESLREHEEMMYSPNASYLMAHNGWVMNADPLDNFAANANVYLRRELIAWSDSVKLRYGRRFEDSPFLWQHMRDYVEEMARLFDGVRLDNCHSTPCHVAEYLLDCARRIKPDLYIVAELFTNSDATDNVFVNRLGITSLIREMMSAWNSHELGRLVYRYGGAPVGAFHQPPIRPLTPSITHALFFDQTHDNPSPIEKRSVFDLLPSTALVNMACCASGSNRGYDELVPHHIHVVNETREYTAWMPEKKDSTTNNWVHSDSGIIAGKKLINNLHYYLGANGFSQVYVDQVDENIVTVTRHNPTTHESVILVAYTSFKHPHSGNVNVKPLRIEGELIDIIFEESLQHKNARYDQQTNYEKDAKYINGLDDYQLIIKEHLTLELSDIFKQAVGNEGNYLQLDYKDFQPGSIVALKVALPSDIQTAQNDFLTNSTHNLDEIIGKMNLADLNRALYRCDQEERDEGYGFAAYTIPQYGALVYCGFQGILAVLSKIRSGNDLGHPLCTNLRDGDWLMDYTSSRLKVDAGTKDLGVWCEKNLAKLKLLPRYLIPAYFDLFITKVYMKLLDRAYHQMSDFVRNGSTFVRHLAMGSVQFMAVIKSSKLPLLSPNLTSPQPTMRILENGEKMQVCVSMAAGLPHFSTGYTRNWGRDTFIAIRGLCLLTGRAQEARYLILAYAACLRHGLIPNLLDGGRNARYNCRDAVWWWLYAIKCYVDEVPNGETLLKDCVSRLYPNDDTPTIEPGIVDQLVQDVMYEALRVHFQGLIFKERNAGKSIDEHMSDRGFNNQIGVHPETGFVFGGNESNCGTWMDKMGSSDKAGNRGKPATPRDGSAIEIVGLSYAVIKWLVDLNAAGKFPYNTIERKHRNGKYTRWTFSEWSAKMREHFEQCYWIGETTSQSERRPELINKRSIYKDCYGASLPWYDYQLRCNFPIAMVAAPELFKAQHAWDALRVAEKHLLGPLGMKTLDASDWNYCGDYDNANDSNDAKVAHGFNYHQGPEWLWPVGYFLRAKLIFAEKVGELPATIKFIKEYLAGHYNELQVSDWRGLPELTNTNGAFCKDSSRTQAWSMACVLEVLYDLEALEKRETFTISK